MLQLDMVVLEYHGVGGQFSFLDREDRVVSDKMHDTGFERSKEISDGEFKFTLV